MSAHQSGRPVEGVRRNRGPAYVPTSKVLWVCQCGEDFLSEAKWREHRVSLIRSAASLPAAAVADISHTAILRC